MRRVLVIAPAWVGDMVMAQTVVASFDARGDAVDILAPPSVADIARKMPGLRSVIDFRSRHGHLDLRMRYRLGRRLAAKNYDVAVVLPNTFKSALVALFAGIPRRIGFVGEARRSLLTRAIDLDEDRWPRMVDRYAALVDEPARQPKLTVDADNAHRLLARFEVSSPYIALCPGGEFGPAKRWPAKHFAELALALGPRGLGTIIVGGPSDIDAAEAIAGGSDAINLVGRTSLSDAVDIIAGAQAAVCNDTGLMHVAAAVGVPVAALFGSTTPHFTPPLTDRAVVLEQALECRPCFARECPFGHTRCLTLIDPAAVIHALGKLGAW